ncbi:hypothetical protein E2C01_056713 [Portunus trituberculatus]|uniref:Uncharacterized protein n=1 Tax=Portunus trituberculatus TaxID=210409 RepID=A0A5B7H1C9_PORTR|nr:hypothetical protein [Portunus trituberculatus]
MIHYTLEPQFNALIFSVSARHERFTLLPDPFVCCAHGPPAGATDLLAYLHAVGVQLATLGDHYACLLTQGKLTLLPRTCCTSHPRTHGPHLLIFSVPILFIPFINFASQHFITKTRAGLSINIFLLGLRAPHGTPVMVTLYSLEIRTCVLDHCFRSGSHYVVTLSRPFTTAMEKKKTVAYGCVCVCVCVCVCLGQFILNS